MAALGRFRFSHAILLSILVYGSSLTTTTATLTDDSSSAAAANGDAHTNLRRRLQLPQLQKTFKDRGAPPTPLPECEGDCDRDSHCAEGLTCFQR